MLSVLKTVRRTNHSKTSLANLFSKAQMSSQVVRDMQRTLQPNQPQNHEINRYAGQFAKKLEDYAITAGEANYELESLAIPTQTPISQSNEVHPLELAARKERSQADIYRRLQPNQALITNLPIDSEVLKTTRSVTQFLHDKVDKDLQIEEVKFIQAITTASQAPRNAYILVTLGSKRQANLVQKHLRKTWIGDSLLKVKLDADANKEHFDNRTILIRNIPTHMNQRQILETFTGENPGAVVGIELPQEIIKLSDKLTEFNLTSPGSQTEQQKLSAFKQAQKAVEKSLQLDQQYQQTLASQIGQQKLDQILGNVQHSETTALIEEEKLNSVLRLVTRLQAEGVQVAQSKLEILKLVEETQKAPGSLTLQDKIESISLQSLDKQNLGRVLKYLRDNSDSAPQIVDEPLEKILSLSTSELANAFDSLLFALNQRESLIEKRIKDQLKHFGSTERILVEKKNFATELEDIEDPTTSLFKIKAEELISVQDQINSVIHAKNLSPEEKFLRLIKGALNPFEDKNFSEAQLKLADLEELDDHKKIEAIDPRLPRSVLRMMREGSDFKPESKEMLNEMIQNLRNKNDIPFDELYHKEKFLVQAVIEAEKALQRKEASLKSPLSNQLISDGDFKQLTADSILNYDSAFDASLKRQSNKINKVDAISGSDLRSGYNFASNARTDLVNLFESGAITKSVYEQQQQLARENETRNLGYCFITYSHSDEARLMLLHNKDCYMLGEKLQFDLKSNIDHSELDYDFFINRARNDSKLINDIKRLRDRKRRLRQFEKEIDSHLPKRQKLKEFREFSKNLIENEQGFIRGSASSNRSNDEEDRLRSKMRELQAKYPHVDLTQLYDTERAENTRKALHKKAFASYKAFEFLKNGVTQRTAERVQGESEAKRRLRENDPYNFPELDQTVAVVLSKDLLQAKMNDHGEVIQTPGRRFKGYTEQEFIEAFFGKDLLRQSVLDYKEDPLFKTQLSLKEKYPLSSFLKTPAIQAKYDKLKALGIEPSLDQLRGDEVYPGDPDLAQMLEKHSESLISGQYLKDKQHPTDPNRTLLADLESTFEKYGAAREKRGLGDTIDMGEITILRQRLAEEYKLKEKDWFQIVQQGKFRYEEADEGEEATPSTDETKSAKFDQSYDGQSRQNKKRSGGRGERNQQVAEQQVDQVFKDTGNDENDKNLVFQSIESGKSKDQTEFYKDVYQNGPWQKDLKFGGEQIKTSSHKKAPTSLSQFANLTKEEQENRDNDLFEHYKNQINQNKAQNIFNVDSDDLNPDLPRFEGYLNSQIQGVHPFDQITNKVNEELKVDSEQSEIERQEEQALYQRELLGRLMGERLTPRQFEIIAGIHKSSDLKHQRVKNAQQQEFLQRKEIIRLQQELAEKLRRQKVIKGEWNEQESHQNLQKHIEDCVSKQLGPNQRRIFERDFAEVVEAVKLMDSPERLLEKEYYFDERLGQSLDEHTAELKSRYPGVKVHTRRDRDGLPIVKTTYEPEFKYKIDEIENWDSDETRQALLQQSNAVLEKIMPAEGPNGVLKSLPERLESVVQQMMGNGEQEYELDAWTKLQIQELVSSQKGLDANTIVQKLAEISENASFDQSKPISFSSQVFQLHEEKTSFDLLFEDRERFRADIYQQLAKRAKKHLFATKRRESDFVLPRVSESQAWSRQIKSHENSIVSLESQASGLESSKNFDRAAFDKLKAEIDQRKKAKERLLSQGLPEFKAYLRF